LLSISDKHRDSPCNSAFLMKIYKNITYKKMKKTSLSDKDLISIRHIHYTVKIYNRLCKKVYESKIYLDDDLRAPKDEKSG
jgi:hypothetical protein